MSEAAIVAAVAARTAVVLVVLVAALRLTGKRQTGEMNLHDLVVVLVVANAVQNSMTRGDGRLSVALASSGTLIACGWLLARAARAHPSAHRGIAGTPTVLVEGGRPLRRNLRREGVTDDELMAAVREKGLADLSGVRLAVLEADGTISVIPREEARVA